MFTKGLKIIILSAAMTAAVAFTSFAGTKSAANFPYDIEFDVDAVDRVCYAGHPGKTVMYKDGIAVTPETSFRVIPNDNNDSAAAPLQNDVAVTVSLVYENSNNSGSYKEVVKQYNAGDIKCDDNYRILSDNNITSLEDRDKLYSDMLTGLEMTVASKSKGSKKTVYLYVCDDVDSLEDMSK